MMQLPELLQKQAEKLLDGLCGQMANDKYQPRHLRHRTTGQAIELYEVRRDRQDPQQHHELPVALLRYSPDLNQWSLHYNDDERWKIYLNVTPTLDFNRLLTTIRQDPLRCFWPE